MLKGSSLNSSYILRRKLGPDLYNAVSTNLISLQQALFTTFDFNATPIYERKSIIRRRCERSDQRASRVISTHSQVAGLACLTRHVAPIRVILSCNRRKQFDLFQKKVRRCLWYFGILRHSPGIPVTNSSHSTLEPVSESSIPPRITLRRRCSCHFSGSTRKRYLVRPKVTSVPKRSKNLCGFF